MNIGFICREYPPAPRVGGIGWATRDQARALARLGHRVHVVAAAADGAETSSDGGVLVHRIPSGGGGLSSSQTAGRLAWSRAAARAVARLDRQEGLDVVEAPEFGAEAYSATARARLPVVVRLHTPLGLVRRLNGTPPSRDCERTIRLERVSLQRAAAVTAPSRAIVGACVEAGYGPLSSGTTVIPFGVDTRRFTPAAGNGGRERPLVLFVGRLEARKGVGTLSRALPAIAARIPEARFALVGADTPTAPEGRSWQEHVWASALETGIADRLELPGPVPRDRLPTWYRQAAIVVAPSPFEAFGLVYVEAMACGRPVVGCSGGAFPEIVTDGREGIAVPARDHDALADAVVGLLEDPDRRAAMGRRARRRAEQRFDLQALAARTAELFAEVARTRSLR